MGTDSPLRPSVPMPCYLCPSLFRCSGMWVLAQAAGHSLPAPCLKSTDAQGYLPSWSLVRLVWHALDLHVMHA